MSTHIHIYENICVQHMPMFYYLNVDMLIFFSYIRTYTPYVILFLFHT
jgi:hypothetical protein